LIASVNTDQNEINPLDLYHYNYSQETRSSIPDCT